MNWGIGSYGLLALITISLGLPTLLTQGSAAAFGDDHASVSVPVNGSDYNVNIWCNTSIAAIGVGDNRVRVFVYGTPSTLNLTFSRGLSVVYVRGDTRFYMINVVGHGMKVLRIITARTKTGMAEVEVVFTTDDSMARDESMAVMVEIPLLTLAMTTAFIAYRCRKGVKNIAPTRGIFFAQTRSS